MSSLGGPTFKKKKKLLKRIMLPASLIFHTIGSVRLFKSFNTNLEFQYVLAKAGEIHPLLSFSHKANIYSVH